MLGPVLVGSVKFRKHTKVYPSEAECQRIGQRYGCVPWKSGRALFVHQTVSYVDGADVRDPRNGHQISWTTMFTELLAKGLCLYYYRGSPPQLLHVGYQPGFRPARSR